MIPESNTRTAPYDENNQTLPALETAVTYGICAYVSIMYFAQGEGLRNTLLFGSFALWLFSPLRRSFKGLVSRRQSKLYFLFVAISLLSTVISIDPLYTLRAVKHELLKAVVLFLTVSTTFTSEEKIKKLLAAFSLCALTLIAAGYYSYLTLDIPYLKPHIPLMHLWHNKFSRALCNTAPFALVLAVVTKNKTCRYGLVGLILLALVALVLSSSRSGYAAALAMGVILAGALLKKNPKRKKYFALCASLFILLNIFSWFVSKDLRDRVHNTARDVKTFNDRTKLWVPIFAAVQEKPLIGWGYGSKLIRRAEPYKDLPHDPPDKGSHNVFLQVAFASGIAGLLSYLALLVYSVRFCIGGLAVRKTYSLSALALLAALAAIIGNYVVHAMFADVSFRVLSLLIGVSIAAAGIDSNKAL